MQTIYEDARLMVKNIIEDNMPQQSVENALKSHWFSGNVYLVSGGGSALFEKPLDGISLEDIKNVTNRLLASGADIVEMNMVRKRFSGVKAGRFAQLAAPARVFAVILSDVLGDRLDTIASGPAVPDTSTVRDAKKLWKNTV